MPFTSNRSMKKVLTLAWLLVLAAGIGVVFWHTARKYSLPTPVPVNYHDVQRGSVVTLPASAGALTTPMKPLFLHFLQS